MEEIKRFMEKVETDETMQAAEKELAPVGELSEEQMAAVSGGRKQPEENEQAVKRPLA